MYKNKSEKVQTFFRFILNIVTIPYYFFSYIVCTLLFDYQLILQIQMLHLHFYDY